MFTAGHNSQRVKMIQCPPNDDWVNKMWYVRTVNYYSAMKRNDIPIHATTWLKLENIMLSEKKPDTKGYILYVSMCVKYPE